MTFNEQKLTLGEMKNYLSEWFAHELVSKTIAGKYDSFERIYQLFEEGSNKVIFEHVFGISQFDTLDAIVSTAGIKDEELRGVVEQCIGLDRQMEQYKKQEEAQAVKQKGE